MEDDDDDYDIGNEVVIGDDDYLDYLDDDDYCCTVAGFGYLNWAEVEVGILWDKVENRHLVDDADFGQINIVVDDAFHVYGYNFHHHHHFLHQLNY